MSWQVSLRARRGSLRLDVQLEGDDAPVALVGPNGSGKTTLLRLIAGAHPPDAGRVRLGARTLYDSESATYVQPERRRIGYVPQGYGLFPHLRVLDNVAFGLSTSARRLPRSERHRLARAQLSALGCDDLHDRLVGDLSGGEQQRVALARALVTGPDLLLLDEPLSAMDVAARRSLRALLADHLRTRACPSLVVTHDVRDVVALGAKVYVLEAGRVVQQGSVAELRKAPASDFVAEFVGVDAALDAAPVSR